MNDEEVKFDIYQAMKSYEKTNTCLRVESIYAIVNEVFKEKTCGDPLAKCIMMNASRHDSGAMLV